MSDPLAPLIADGIVEDVISRLKTGKEAEIFIVQHAGEICAAKVYKDRQQRSFRNNAAYKEGRTSRNSRTQRAMDSGTRFGQQAAEDAWKAKEFEALQKLHGAGVRVPQPLMLYEGVLLMEIVIDPEGHPAPRLIDAAIPRERAAEYYADLRQQVIRILRCDLIHGDLSPYNVLLAWNGPTLIDFPQVVGAAHNSQASFFFQRDLQTLQRFFAAIDPALNASAQDAPEIWRAYERGELTENFVPTGRFVEARSHKPRKQKNHPPRDRAPQSASAPTSHAPSQPRGAPAHHRRGAHRSPGGGGPTPPTNASQRAPAGGTSPHASHGSHRKHPGPGSAQPAPGIPRAHGGAPGSDRKPANPASSGGHPRGPKPRDSGGQGRNGRGGPSHRETKTPAVSFVNRPALPPAEPNHGADRPAPPQGNPTDRDKASS